MIYFRQPYEQNKHTQLKNLRQGRLETIIMCSFNQKNLKLEQNVTS